MLWIYLFNGINSKAASAALSLMGHHNLPHHSSIVRFIISLLKIINLLFLLSNVNGVCQIT